MAQRHKNAEFDALIDLLAIDDDFEVSHENAMVRAASQPALPPAC